MRPGAAALPGLRSEGLVVGGVEFFVGAGARDAHAGAAFGVEEERGAPAVEEFAGGAIDRGVVGRDEGEAEFVLAGEDGGDLGVGADGVAVAGESVRNAVMTSWTTERSARRVEAGAFRVSARGLRSLGLALIFELGFSIFD